jgi:hypothetical protein
MNTNTKIISGIISFIALLILFFWLNNNFRYDKYIANIKQSSNDIIYDTIYKYEQPKTIEIQQAKPKIKYIRDTIIITKPFIAQIDTIVKKDTIQIFYTYPENLLSMKINQTTDSTMIIKQINYREKERNWWETPALIISGILVGYIITK